MGHTLTTLTRERVEYPAHREPPWRAANVRELLITLKSQEGSTEQCGKLKQQYESMCHDVQVRERLLGELAVEAFRRLPRAYISVGYDGKDDEELAGIRHDKILIKCVRDATWPYVQIGVDDLDNHTLARISEICNAHNTAMQDVVMLHPT